VLKTRKKKIIKLAMNHFMRTIYLLLAFIFISQLCSAQLGYFGKRNAIKFDGHFSPAYREIDGSFNSKLAGLATTANFNVSRIVSARHSLSFEYSYFKDFMTSNDNYGLLLVRYLRQNSMGMGFTRFRKPWLAPIGSYWKYTFMINKNDVSEQKDFAQMATWYSMKIGACYGYQRVISDKFLIDIGITFNLHVGKFGKLSAEEEGFIGNSAPFSIFFREMLRFKIGFGYLL